MRTAFVVLGTFGPAAAAALVAVVPGRIVRRALWFAAMAVSLAAAGELVAEAYGGSPLGYRSLRAGLLPATFVAAVQAGAVLLGMRAATLSRPQERLAQAGLGIAVAAVAAGAFTTSAAVLALFMPVPALALAAATIAGRRDAIRAPGLVGLALADVAALAGLFLLVRRTDSNLLGAAGPDTSSWLLLGSAAVKAGLVPWVGAWGAGDGVPAARLVQVAVRAQALALVLVVAVSRPELDGAVLAGAAAALGLACGTSALIRGRGLAGAAAIGPAVALLAVALGGAVGFRSLALLLPTLPVVWGMAWMLAVAPDVPSPPAIPPAADPSAEPDTRVVRPVWAILSSLGLAAAMGALVLVPLTGTHPGAHLTLALAATRAAEDPSWLIPVAAILAGAALASTGAVAAIRDAVPGRLGLVGLAVGSASLYAGLASAPLALGWLARVERDVGGPVVLPAAGAPGLPPAPALRLVLAVLPAFVLVGVVTALSRGVRPPGPLPAAGRLRPLPRPASLGVSPRDQVRFLVLHAARAGLTLHRWFGRVRATGAAWAAFALAEGVAVLLVIRVVLDAAGRGFL